MLNEPRMCRTRRQLAKRAFNWIGWCGCAILLASISGAQSDKTDRVTKTGAETTVGDKWARPSAQEFGAAFQLLLQAEPEGFRSLMGARQGEAFDGTLTLPSMHDCSVRMYHDVYGYTCYFPRSHYNDVIALVEAALPASYRSEMSNDSLENFVWKASDPTKPKSRWRAQVVVSPLSSGLKTRFTSRLIVFAGKTESDSTAGPLKLPKLPEMDDSDLASDKSIESEIEATLRRGHYSPLPAATCSAPSDSKHGSASLSIENGTAYRLIVLMTGGVELRISIEPHQIVTQELPAGSYRVVGRVGAPNVLPFYGPQVFGAGVQCSSHFYIR
jgi:hypothetical protein